MRVDILTLFPGMFESVLSQSILKRARESARLDVRVHDIRLEAKDRHRTCDDRPFGGGPGMVLKAEPIDRTLRRVVGTPAAARKKGAELIYMSAQGEPLKQKTAEALSKKRRLVVLCGHYEGVDHRLLQAWAMREISLGDFILTGGEIPAMALLDAVARLLPGVLGNAESKSCESFSENLLEYPQYTRPALWRRRRVPAVLLTGNHAAIDRYRREESARRTAECRPDLLEKQTRRKRS
ncbi:MAG: tRNA (guanosine(37)-N1)-methyltransferase TrmD [Candidatus Omnitrophica bacterium]|nr:tRNA (guanosine(37)-N1)-methyltransferase TrmD [Candidatus Omnitrophota bacterium]